VSEEFDILVDEYLEFSHKDSPLSASFMGLEEFDGEWGDFSPEGMKASLAKYREFKDRFLAMEDISFDDEIDRRIIISQIRNSEISLDDYDFFSRFPSAGMQIASSGIFILLSRAEKLNAQKCEVILSRLDGVPELLSAVSKHINAVCSINREVALEAAEGTRQFFSSLPSILEKEGYDAKNPAKKALTAVEGYISFLKDLPEVGDNYATGKEIFSAMLSDIHLLPMSVEEIEEMGIELLDSSKKRQKELAQKIDPTKETNEVIADLKSHHPTVEELSDTYKRYMESARQFIIDHGLIDLPDGERLDMISTPPFHRGIIPYAAYLPPVVYGSQQVGKFMVTPVEEEDAKKREEILRGHCTYRLPGVSLHEGYPGHHLQMSWATRTERSVRKETYNNIFIEGWALYCEQMMTEEGFISTPQEKLFLANDLVWRGARVIVDIGIHCKKKGYDWAVEFMMKEAGLEKPHAETECKRYISTPTQPLSYAVGRRIILHLREQIKRKLGEKFSLKDFHNCLMGYGSLHAPLIAEEVEKSYAS